MSGTQRGFGEIDYADAVLNFGSSLTGTWGYSVNGVVSDMGSFAASSLLRSYTFLASDPFADLSVFFTPDSAGNVSFALGTVSNNGTGPVLDNVSLSMASVTSAVPEPATWAMMILGFGAIGAAMRRRNVAAAAIA